MICIITNLLLILEIIESHFICQFVLVSLDLCESMGMCIYSIYHKRGLEKGDKTVYYFPIE